MRVLYIGHGITKMGRWPKTREWEERQIVRALRAEGHVVVYSTKRYRPKTEPKPDGPFDVVLWNRRTSKNNIGACELRTISKEYSCPMVYWHCDGFRTSWNKPRPKAAWFWEVAPLFDLVLHTERGLFAEYEERTGTPFRYSMRGVDLGYYPAKCKPYPGLGCDVGFIGKRDSLDHPELYARRNDIIRHIADAKNVKFRAWAISQKPWREWGIPCEEGVCGGDYGRACVTAKINLGVSAKAWCDGAWSNRAVNVMACGGFLLHENTPGFADFFRPGEHCAVFDPDSKEDALAQVKYWLARPEGRKRIAAAGQAHVRANHTWRHRVREAVGHMRACGLLEGGA